MNNNVSIEELAECALKLLGRIAIPLNQVEEIVRGSGKTPTSIAKLVRAFNLCDGSRNQSEIAKAVKLDQGNFNRTLVRWVQHGVVYKIGNGKSSKFLHIYPIPEKTKK